MTNELTEKSVSGAVHAGKITFLNIVGGHTLLSVGFDDKLRFLSLQHATSTVMDSEVVALHGQPNCIATLPASSIFFAVSTSTEVALFMNRKQVGQLSLPSSSSFSANCVALASESEVAVGCTDFKTRVYSISDDYAFTLLTSIETRSAVMALAYNPSCEHLAVGDNGRQVEVFARGTWSPLVTQVWSFHSSRVTCMAWSPSGAYLATGSVDECIIVWDFYSPLKKNIIPFAHSGGVTSLVWTDEENLVSSGNDHTIVTWKIPASSVV